MQQLRPTAVINHTEQVPYVPPSLALTTHVFIRDDTVKPAMKQPYDGPFLVIDRKAKFFIVRRRGRDDKVSIDRLKPAFISDQDADDYKDHQHREDNIFRLSCDSNSAPVALSYRGEWRR